MRWLALLAVLLALATPAHARDPGAAVRERLTKGRSAYAAQDYREAIRTLRPILKDAAATRAQKVQALELVGLSLLITGQNDAARDSFEDLLALDPAYVLTDPSNSPKLRRFFETVKKGYLPSYQPGGEAVLEHEAPTGAGAGHRLELAAAVVEGAPKVKTVVLLWRRRGLLDYVEVAMTERRGRWLAALTPPADRSGYVLEYYLEARNLAGGVLARAGGPDAPLALPLRGSAAAERPWYKRWYVWAGAGAVVAAGVTVGVVAAGADKAPNGTLAPGRVTLSK